MKFSPTVVVGLFSFGVLILLFTLHSTRTFTYPQHPFWDMKLTSTIVPFEPPIREELNQTYKMMPISSYDRFQRSLQTEIECTDPSYNRSCLFKNLYYVDGHFTILTVKGTSLPDHKLRIDAFALWFYQPRQREFDSLAALEHFVRRNADPMVLPSVTLFFAQPWHHNIGHALFDGLYAAYVALIRFPPRHLLPFRVLAGISECTDCFSEDIYSRFAGLGIIKEYVLNKMSKNRWFLFEEIVMGSGTFCQRCTQPNFQLPGGVSLDGSRLFRDRMYQQHGLILPPRRKHSSDYRKSRDILEAIVIDNKRYFLEDRNEIKAAIDELNTYVDTHEKDADSEWPLIRVRYVYYGQVRAANQSYVNITVTKMDFRSPVYELTENNFMAQLKLLRQADIHVSGPGTGQMYQTFLQDGSVNVNIGGLRPWGLERTNKSYTSYLEQHMTSGAPYIKGLYYPINERPKGITKNNMIRLILKGFSIPVNPLENLGADGQLFVEMCEKDVKLCASVTERLPDRPFACLEFWVEDFVHEQDQWKEGGIIRDKTKTSCQYNYTLLRQLREKYHIDHLNVNW